MTQLSDQTRSPHFALDSTARTYRDVHLPRVFRPWARVLLDLVPPPPASAVIDVATGPGTVAREAALLIGPRGRVVGVDISAAMLAVGREWTPEPGAAPIEYIEAPATAIPVPDATFDAAYCQQGLQHMADSLAALREIHRILRPGATLGVATWRQSPFGLFRDVINEMGITGAVPQPSNFGHDADDLARALRQTGFVDVEVHAREMETLLEGGIPEAVRVGASSSAGAVLAKLPEQQREEVRAAFARALEPLTLDGVVHLLSRSNIASARRDG